MHHLGVSLDYENKDNDFFLQTILTELSKPAQSMFLPKKMCFVLALRSSEPPGVPHHENKVGITVDGGTDTAVVVNKLFLGHLCVREEGSFY